MTDNRRTKQVAEAIRDELVTILRRDISDPRLEAVGFLTVSGVALSDDHRSAVVHVSFMGKTEDQPEVEAALEALSSAANYIHRLLIKRIPMKLHPRLHFKYDNMFDRAAVISQALQEASAVEVETKIQRVEKGITPESEEELSKKYKK